MRRNGLRREIAQDRHAPAAARRASAPACRSRSRRQAIAGARRAHRQAAARRRAAAASRRRAPSRRAPGRTPPIGRRSSGSMPCAAMPANSARVRSSMNARRASASADRSACSPKRASAIGMARPRERAEHRRARAAATSSDAPSRSAVDTPRRRGPSADAVRSSDRYTTAAVPSSNGCASIDWRLDPLEAVRRQRQRPEERRRDGERMDRRADVVDETRQRELAPTARRRRSSASASNTDDLAVPPARGRSRPPARSVRSRSTMASPLEPHRYQ